MWTVAEELPSNCLREEEQDVDIVNSHKFDINEIEETWHLPILRHRKLGDLVRRLERYGLGRNQDILLCMIPALSFKDLLPNERILRLIPQMSPGCSSVETARCYHNSLKTMRTHIEGHFTFSVVAMTMDFLNLAFEPYGEDRDVDDYDDLSNDDDQSSDDGRSFDPREELLRVAKTLATEKFGEVVQRLAPIYELQNRRRDFLVIFKHSNQSTGEEDDPQWLDRFIQTFQEEVKIESDFFELHGRNLDFTRAHKIMCINIAIRRGIMQGVHEPLEDTWNNEGR